MERAPHRDRTARVVVLVACAGVVCLLAGTAAWTALVGGAVGWFVGTPEHPPESGRAGLVQPAVVLAIIGAAGGYLLGIGGPEWAFIAGILLVWKAGPVLRWDEARASAPRIAIGISILGGLAGIVAGLVVGTVVLDARRGRVASDGLLVASAIGFGIGWLVACIAGVVAVRRDAPPADPAQAWTIRAFAVGAAIAGVGLVAFEGMPGYVVGSTTAQWWTVIDAALVASTLALLAGWRGRAPARPPRWGHLGGLANAGVVSGVVLVLLGVPVVYGARAAGVDARNERLAWRQARANDRTAQSLTDAATRLRDAHGVYPAGLIALIAAGARIRPGSHVNFVGVVPGGFCVRVGTEDGTGYGGPPFSSMVVYPQPPHQTSWMSGEATSADACPRDGVSR